MSTFREPPQEIVEKLEQINGYAQRRKTEFAELGEQLDKLYHDIDAGLFGESAKTGEFYAHIYAVKNAQPKPDNLDQIKTELDELIANDIQELD